MMVLKPIRLRAMALLCAAALLSACGGHAGGVLPSQPGAANPRGGNAKATLVVKIPKAAAQSARRPAYISASTQSIAFAYSIGATTYPAQNLNVTPTSPGCSTDGSGNTVCTLTFGANAGSAAYTVTAYDGLNATGKALATAQASMTIVAGQNNQFNMTLDGVAASFGLSLTGADATGAIPAGTKATVGLNVSAYDADGNLIVNSPALTSATGTALTTATLDLAPDNGEFTVSQNGKTLTASGGGYALTAPFTGVSIAYNGGRMTDLALTLGVGSFSAQTTLHVEPVLSLYTVQGSNPALMDLTAGSDGNIWFTDPGQNSVGRVTPGGSIIEYPVQAADAQPDRIVTDAAGNMWFTETGNSCACVAKLSTDGSVAATYPGYQVSCQPYPMAIGVDKNEDVWYSDGACDRIGYINMNTGTGSSFTGNNDDTNLVVTADGRAWTLGYDSSQNLAIVSTDLANNVAKYDTQISGASALTVGKDGNLWFSDVDNGGTSYIGYLDTSTNKIAKEYPIPQGSNAPWYPMPVVLAPGPDGNIWFSYDVHGPSFGYVDPASGNVTFVTLYGNPTVPADTGHLIAGPDGNLWFVNVHTLNATNDNVVGKITIGS